MTELVGVASGVALTVAGLLLTFGPWTLIPAGLVVVVACLLIDFEGALHGKPDRTPPLG